MVFLAMLLWMPRPCVAVESREGVVLLHGLGRRAASMEKLARRLSRAGYVVVNQAYPSRSGSVETLSERAVSQALGEGRLKVCEVVHFVTHSMAGMLVRSYFDRHRDSRLGRVVMLGPPNGGSEVVDRLGRWRLFRKLLGPAGCELGTGKGALPSRLGPVDFELGVIAGNRSINWINSWLIPGRDDGKVSVRRTRVQEMKDHVVVPVTHPFLMQRDQVADLTLRFLRWGSFAPATKPSVLSLSVE